MQQNFALLKQIYNTFDPFRPLPAGDPAYVDCKEVRGDGDILVEVGREILYSDRITCQLYAGHRGAGKSTELLRLQKYLDDQGCFVVYFAADKEDIEPEDAQYTDILLACTRCLLEALKDNANPEPLLTWLKDRWHDLKDVIPNVSLEGLSVEKEIPLFAKITANLRTEPTLRHKIRERVDPHTTTLIAALNQFIEDAKKRLPDGYSQLVVIADNLDRIVPITQEDGRSNHEHIFLDRSEQLKALDCHLIYTVPISLVYSNRATDLRDIYGSDAQVLPMIMVQTPDNQSYQRGIDKVKEVLQKRISRVDSNLSITDMFEQPETLQQLCLMSGGHVRNLLLLMKEAIKYTDTLPISKKVLQRSISETRITYRNTVYADEWLALAKVYHFKQIENDERHRNLLFNRCILEYRYRDADEQIQCWYDIHPLIKGIKEFQDAFNQQFAPE
ncbi:ATP-binding protein [Halotia branconii]|uniref:ATP-binding protein n=1 Tax=Halotia branconii CENA392 TaxID=1539056 RepID=A0AAJ6PBK9_9CYAN|nr:ATP-binding protein [Halotia branconii]WGV27856.1 ATP-binding protein [Halotia branconii CENA392]